VASVENTSLIDTCRVSALARSTSTFNCGAVERNVLVTRCKPLCACPSRTNVLVVVCSLVRSKLPSRSSTCMVKPAALPIP
jgi:hypothetical protein